MTKKNPVYLTVLLVAVAIVVTFQLTIVFTGSFKAQDDGNVTVQDTSEQLLGRETIDKLKEIARQYAAYYPGDIDPELVERYLISALIGGVGDNFGNYFYPEAFAERLQQLQGNYKGIGVTVEDHTDEGYLKILSVTEGSPAEEAGVKPGDRITHAGEQGKSVSELGYTGTVAQIKGEEGTYAHFTVSRDGQSIDFKVERRTIVNKTVSYELIDGEFRSALIRITQFDGATADQFAQALQKASDDGVDGYVFDVRSNPGGELTAVTDVLDMLLGEGPIIRIEYKDESQNKQIDSDARKLDAPMVVLCNGSTASAGELFCAALKDYGVATLIGEQTYGKGTMQSYLKLSDGSGLALTIAYYLPPFSGNYHGVGVTPDTLCELPGDISNTPIDQIPKDRDLQLQTALGTLQKAVNNK